MTGWHGSTLTDTRHMFLHKLAPYAHYLFREPHPRRRAFAVIRFAEHLDASVPAEGIHLPECGAVSGRVDGIGGSAELVQNAERGDIRRTIRDIDHVPERNPPVPRVDLGIDVYRLRVLIGAFVDFEQVARLRGVVERARDLRDLAGLRRIVFRKAGLRWTLDEFTAENIFKVGRDRTAADGFSEPRAHHVMFERHSGHLELRIVRDKLFHLRKELRESGIKFQFLAAFPEDGV